tara:strand:+ start:66 stop:767 length:702 start_codon:yes stop_codon:yes gene_type:complete
MTKKKICTRVDDELWAAFRVEAMRQGSSVEAFLSQAIEEKISSPENKRKNKKPEKRNKKPEKPEASRAPVNKINNHFNSTVNNKTLTKTKPPKTPPTGAKNAYLAVQDTYNRIAINHSKADHLPGFKLCRRLSTNRKRGIDRLLKELGSGLTAEEYFILCCKNRHWRGDNSRRWRADLEFLTRDENISKALELETTDEQTNKPTAFDFFPEEQGIIDITDTATGGNLWRHSKH